MSRSKPSLSVVPDGKASSHKSEDRRAPASIRRRANGSLEYRSESEGKTEWRRFCSPIEVLALPRDADNRNWGRLLKVTDPDGRFHRWAMPASLLASPKGIDYRKELLNLGAELAGGPKAEDALHRYLRSTRALDGTPLPRARAALRTGWHDDVFVLPDRALGTTELVVYQNGSAIRAAIRQQGTLDEWKLRIAEPCAGNSRLVLAISTAFAATLLGPLGIEGAGIHFRGASSIGKTTALRVAGSVWGGPGGAGLSNYLQSWQATANAIENLAEAHSDLPLCLDELGMVEAEHASRVAYQLASGIGRARANDAGLGTPRRTWRTFLLSTGEVGLADKLSEARFGPRRQTAGQAVRFIDLPAETNSGLGIFDHAPDGDSERFARELSDACRHDFGTAGPAFVVSFIEKRDEALRLARQQIDSFVASAAHQAFGQVKRVAQTFGLIAAAGELALSFGIVPWPPGEATRAAHTCLCAWYEARRGDGAGEDKDIVATLREVIEKDAARFQPLVAKSEQQGSDSRAGRRRAREQGVSEAGNSRPPQNRIGFTRQSGADIEYLILPSAWNTIWAGQDRSRAGRFLIQRSILKPGGDQPARKERVGGPNPERVYVISHNALFADDERRMGSATGDEIGKR